MQSVNAKSNAKNVTVTTRDGSAATGIIVYDGVINIEGGNIIDSQTSNSHAIYSNSSACSINITGGYLEGKNFAIYANHANISIENAVLSGGIEAENANITIKEGTSITIRRDGGYSQYYLFKCGNSTLQISGGSFIPGERTDLFYSYGDDPKSIVISGGTFTEDLSEHMATGYQMILGADGLYHTEVISASAIRVEFVKVETDPSGRTYDIILVPDEDEVLINRLNSADLTFDLAVADPKDKVAYRVQAAEGAVAVNPVAENRYEFHFTTKDDIDGADTGKAVIIGQVVFEGYGDVVFSIAEAETNAIQTTAVQDNIVTSYVVGGGTEENVGNLIINDQENNGVIEESFEEATRRLNISIFYHNNIWAGNSAEYNDMKVTVSGTNGDVFVGRVGAKGIEESDAIVYDEDYTAEAASFVFDVKAGYQYTVTVEGAGYRTARYSTLIAADSIEEVDLNFWNNVMDADTVIETGNDKSTAKVTYLAGDIVKDNDINIYDLSAVVSYFGTVNDATEKSDYAKYDLNRDGKIDSKDVAMVLVSWGN